MTQELATKEKTAQMVRYETERGEVALSVDFVRKYFCPNANGHEAFAFMQLCRFHRLNPFLREAYLVKYGQNDSAQFIVGYQAWTQRAEKAPNYKGFKAGLILAKEDGAADYREGTFYRKNEELEGGWCEVYLSDREYPVRIEVALHEYIQRTKEGKPNRFWGEKPGTMIRKVAIAQCHREAFPSLFAGLYDQGELDSDNDLPTDAVVVEGSGTWLESDDAPPNGHDTSEDIREPQETPVGDILGPDEAPDAPMKLPASCSSMVLLRELWQKYRWDDARVEAEVLGGKKIADYLAGGDNTKGKMTNALYIKWREKAGV